MVRINEARTLLPPWGLVNFSRMVYRGISSRSPGSVSSNPISTKFIGSFGGVIGANCCAGGVTMGGAVVDCPGTTGVDGVTDWGIVVTGVADLGGAGVIGVEGGGMRVTGVVIGARGTFETGTGLILPVGGGIRVTGVITRVATGGGTGAGGLLIGTGGMGAAWSSGFG